MLNKLLKSSVTAFLVVFLTACSAKVQPAPVAAPQLDGQQLTFASPQQAVEALASAVNKADTASLALIFGPEAKDLLHSGDPVADKEALQGFSRAIAEKIRVVELKKTDPKIPAREIAWLEAGKEHWPFPIPLLKEKNGWKFDTANGKQEIINRRIGKNELNVIKSAKEYVDAQLEYYAQDRDSNGVPEFAQKFISTPGKKDGLFWEPVEGEALSPMGPLVAIAAIVDGYSSSSTAKPRPFHGYYFRILTSQGRNARGGAKNYIRNGKMTEGFALLAYPAEWDNSGAMSFLVGPDGVTYQKNLGADTAKLAGKITKFDPDMSWNPI